MATQEQNIEIIDNSPEQILLACKDLLYLISKNFVATNDKLEMSNKFWKKYLRAKKIHNIDFDYYKKILLNHIIAGQA